jgi:DNA-3-methyladenine glycosylase
VTLDGSTGDAASGRTRRLPRPEGTVEPLPAAFFDRPAAEVARSLLGMRLVSDVGGVGCAVEIVETEAYVGPEDEASHGHLRLGMTPRNAAMFGPPGIAYVYRIYGIHWCLNAVTGEEGFPAAVLVRAARPLEGVEAMRARRPGRPERDLLRGPGNLCRALGVGGELNLHPLAEPPLRLAAGEPVADADVARGPRIGISRAADLPLRFWVRGSPWVSATRREPGPR